MSRSRQLTEAMMSDMARMIWQHEAVELRTVGIDIGSSTSHLLFAKVVLQRHSQGLSSRFVVVDREIVYRSPITFTPFLPDGTIDAGSLARFIDGAYEEAGLARDDIDSGAVILTGEAIKRTNAHAIDELFAGEAGKFVCATAGHTLEARLAAQGSGSVGLSKDRSECVLHIDIGGGTTKLALIDRGVIVGLSAFAVGGRLIAADSDGHWTRVDEAARLAADDLGLSLDPDRLADPELHQAVATRLARVAADYIVGAPRDALGIALRLADDLPRDVKPTVLTFSGGVSEYIFDRESRAFGDIAVPLARELKSELSRRTALPIVDPGHRIHATVIGASQFAVQVSGKTVYLSDRHILPVRNIPVVHFELTSEADPTDTIRNAIKAMALQPNARMALAFSWQYEPEYHRIAAVGRAIIAATAPDGSRVEPLFLMIDGDIGKTIGQLLHRELDFPSAIVSIDGVQLQALDYVDIGELMSPPGVIPVVIKSLLFS